MLTRQPESPVERIAEPQRIACKPCHPFTTCDFWLVPFSASIVKMAVLWRVCWNLTKAFSADCGRNSNWTEAAIVLSSRKERLAPFGIEADSAASRYSARELRSRVRTGLRVWVVEPMPRRTAPQIILEILLFITTFTKKLYAGSARLGPMRCIHPHNGNVEYKGGIL